MTAEECLQYFNYRGHPVQMQGDHLIASDQQIPVIDGIPRFTPNESYATGNFSRLREQHATLQLDSRNGTTDRRDTILTRTKWPKSFFAGKVILECGCGAGPDTEILLSFGACVIAVDIAGVDIAKANLGDNPRLCLAQASIIDLPLQKKAFDIVFCHRVLQHTPDPAKTLDHILRFVKDDGAVFVHSYARTVVQMFRWKYAFRPVTRRMNPEKLYTLIKWYAPFAFRLTNFIRKIPGGEYVNYILVPFLNYRPHQKFANLSSEEILEYGIHDTFDALSPRYDKPLSAHTMRQIAERHLTQPFEIEQRRTVTLLRTIVNEQPTSFQHY